MKDFNSMRSKKNKMGALCIIIGFQYEGKYKIPGILIDMFRVYLFAKKAKMKVMVITDIEKDNEDKELSKGISLKNCDSRIFSFIQSLQQRGEYQYWTSLPYLKHMISSFLSPPFHKSEEGEGKGEGREEEGEERLFFYYTGHAKNKELLMPDLTLTPTEEFTENIPQTQLFFLFDCCNASYVDLPFLLTMDFSVSRYRTTAVTKGGMYYLHTSTSNFTPKEIICISSAMVDEDAIATWTGSTFTQLFFQTLELYENERNVHQILKKIQEVLKGKQSCRAYASHPTLIVLFPWLFNPNIKKIQYGEYGFSVCLE